MDFDNVLSMAEMEKYARSLAASADLSISWTEPGTGVCCTAKTLFMPRFTFPLQRQRIIEILHGVEHEISHVKRSDFDMLEKLNCHAGNSFLGFIQNAVEDQRIEYIPAREYRGTAQIIDEGYDTLTKSLIKQMSGKEVDQKMVDLCRPLLQWDAELRADWHASAITKDFMKGASSDADEYMRRFNAHPELAEKVRAFRGKEGRAASWEAHEIAKEIYEKVYQKDAKEELERLQQEKQKAEEGKEGDEGAEGEGDGEGESGDGKGKSKGKGKGENGDEEGGNFEPFQSTPRHVNNPMTAGGKPGGRGDYGYGQYEPSPLSEAQVLNFSHPDRSTAKERKFKEALTKSTSSGPYGGRIMRNAGSTDGAAMAVKVRNILQVRSQKHYSFGHKTGKVHGASLYRAELKVPGVSDRVFKQRHQSMTLDTAIAVAIDMSGSMSHAHKIEHAVHAASLLNSSLGNALKLPLMVYGFSGVSSSNLFVLRDFDDNIVPEDTFLRRAAVSVDVAMQQNLDGEAVLFGFEALKSAKAKRKLLIVLSDGSPASCRHGDSDAFLKEVCKKVEASPTELVGIGVLDDSVKRYYRDHFVIDSPNEIESALLGTIKAKLV